MHFKLVPRTSALIIIIFELNLTICKIVLHNVTENVWIESNPKGWDPVGNNVVQLFEKCKIYLVESIFLTEEFSLRILEEKSCVNIPRKPICSTRFIGTLAKGNAQFTLRHQLSCNKRSRKCRNVFYRFQNMTLDAREVR